MPNLLVLFLVTFFSNLVAAQLISLPSDDSDPKRDQSITNTESFEFRILKRSNELEKIFKVVGTQRTPYGEDATLSKEIRTLWHDIARMYELIGPDQVKSCFGISDFPLPSPQGKYDQLSENADNSLKQIDDELERLRSIIGMK